MKYTAFNQSGKAIMSSDSYAQILIEMMRTHRFYFICDASNKLLTNEMRGRALPKRTSRGSIQMEVAR